MPACMFSASLATVFCVLVPRACLLMIWQCSCIINTSLKPVIQFGKERALHHHQLHSCAVGSSGWPSNTLLYLGVSANSAVNLDAFVSRFGLKVGDGTATTQRGACVATCAVHLGLF
jgi:hypothetical protein